ncbi:MAG TPA: SMI1/KNR4 family protein [Kofleriaceae bacterium]|jgi:serine/threonine protein phosphatase PrpC
MAKEALSFSFEDGRLEDPADPTELAVLRAAVPQLPDDFIAFLAKTNGGEGLVARSYLRLEPAEGLLAFNRDYQVSVCAPGFFLFGGNGGGEAYGFDLEVSPPSVVIIPLIVMERKAAIKQADSFTRFLLGMKTGALPTFNDDLPAVAHAVRVGAHAGLEYAIAIASARAEGQDRATVVYIDGGVVIALADGAGGTLRGGQAADVVIAAIEERPTAEAELVLNELDDPAVMGGETTAVIATVSRDRVRGASVGDSVAWVIAADVIELTKGQRRKPLLGGGCTPVSFDRSITPTATLVIASDGLARYAKLDDIARAVRGMDLSAAAGALLELVRLPTGALQDDVSIVLCRVAY